jgi:hypothetical protein
LSITHADDDKTLSSQRVDGVGAAREMNDQTLSSRAGGWLRAMLGDDDKKETITTEAQRKTEGTEEIKGF